MNLDIQDPDLLSSLSPGNVQGYLRSSGWKETFQDPGVVSFFTLPAKPDDYEVRVPLSESVSGYPQRIKELLRELKTVEQRSELRVFQDIQEWNCDVHRIGIDGHRQCLPSLEFSRQLIESARQLMLSTASSLMHPKPAYGNDPSREVADYLGTIERTLSRSRFRSG